MNFTKLSNKFNRLLKKRKRGKRIKPEKVEKLLRLLNKKKTRYENKLKTDLTDSKRKSLTSKLKVVDAQIVKTEKLFSDQVS